MAFLSATTFFKNAIEINQKTNYSVDFELSGNWDTIEVRIYDNKDIMFANQILNESFDLFENGADAADEKIILIEEKLTELLKEVR